MDSEGDAGRRGTTLGNRMPVPRRPAASGLAALRRFCVAVLAGPSFRRPACRSASTLLLHDPLRDRLAPEARPARITAAPSGGGECRFIIIYLEFCQHRRLAVWART